MALVEGGGVAWRAGRGQVPFGQWQGGVVTPGGVGDGGEWKRDDGDGRWDGGEWS